MRPRTWARTGELSPQRIDAEPAADDGHRPLVSEPLEVLQTTLAVSLAALDPAELADHVRLRRVAEERGREALRLAHQLRDRQMTVFILALLAGFASAARDGRGRVGSGGRSNGRRP
ncbi:MAG: hypothetical protein ACM3QU_11555, partial [Verrucomicrobiota bacterium]